MISIINTIQCGTMERITRRIGGIGTLSISWLLCKFLIHLLILSSTMMKLNINNIFRLSQITMFITILSQMNVHNIHRIQLQESHVLRQITKLQIIRKVKSMFSYKHNKTKFVSIAWMTMTYTLTLNQCKWNK